MLSLYLCVIYINIIYIICNIYMLYLHTKEVAVEQIFIFCLVSACITIYIYIYICIYMYIHIYTKQTNRRKNQSSSQIINRQTDRQTNKQTRRPKEASKDMYANYDMHLKHRGERIKKQRKKKEKR